MISFFRDKLALVTSGTTSRPANVEPCQLGGTSAELVAFRPHSSPFFLSSMETGRRRSSASGAQLVALPAASAR